MLPNWLYGKSKSKLTSILGGGGGTPADYNQVKAQVSQNTEDILLLSDALDDKAALTQITNPNLFDNPWFTINQRGLSNYVQAGYGVDRWRINADNTPTIEFTNNGIEISNYVAGNIVLYQRYESNFINNSKDYTLSIMTSDGTILSSALKKDGSLFRMGELAGAQFYHKVAEVGDTFEIEIFVNTITSNLAIRAAKLELGSVSTLGMDTEPNYATELLKCQRYYQKFNFSGNGPIGFGFAGSGVSARIAIPLLAPMRITGQIASLTNGYEKIVILNNNTEHAVSMLATRVNECYCFLDITSSDLTPNKLCVAKQGTGAFILEIAADL